MMKHFKNIKFPLFILSILIVFASCKSNQKDSTRNIELLPDTSSYHNNTFSDTSKLTETEVVPEKENAVSHDRAVNSSNKSGKVSSKNNSGSVSKGSTSSNSGTASNSGTTSTPATAQKKGWSKAAQGAVIGGVGGAVGGAIISKKKGTGAAIGAAVGAAGGYIIGRQKDKKDGRVK